jgi:hypothetical protein
MSKIEWLASSVGGVLNKIPNCLIRIPYKNGPPHVIEFNTLPTISDGKGAKYDAAGVIGRSMPILTYASSETRQIGLELPFVTLTLKGSGIGSRDYNLQALRAIMSATYPRTYESGAIFFSPPPVCYLKFGKFLTADIGFCALLEKYSVKNDPAVPTDPETLMPYKFTISTSWSVVYDSEHLPGQERIFTYGI